MTTRHSRIMATPVHNSIHSDRTKAGRTEQRRISTRLERLAAPRHSSTWKKPLKNKTNSCSTLERYSSPINEGSTNNFSPCQQCRTSSSTNAKKMDGKEWRESVSPKIGNMLSKINLPSDRGTTSIQRSSSSDKSKGEIERDSLRLFEGDDNWLESEERAATSSSIKATLPYVVHSHSTASSYVQDELQNNSCLSALKNELDRLRCEATGRNQYISELQAHLKQKNEMLKKLSKLEDINQSNDLSEVICDPEYTGVKSSFAVQKVRMALSPALCSGNKSTDQTSRHVDCNDAKMKANAPPFDDLQKKQDEMILQLSNDLDSKLVEIDQIRLFHQIEIDLVRSSYESSIFETHEEMALTAVNNKPPEANMNAISNKINQVEIKSLVSELKRLKAECNEMRRNSTAAFHVANDALEQNCNTIMRYVHEEVEGNGREKSCMALQKELEDTRAENLNLKAEISRLLEKRVDKITSDKYSQNTIGVGGTKTPATLNKRESFMNQLSPLPTMESWANFCNRFKEALAGNDQGVKKGKVLLDDANGVEKANNLLKELCFARDGTPFTKSRGHAGYRCGDDEDDTFMDAMYTLEEDINL